MKLIPKHKGGKNLRPFMGVFFAGNDQQVYYDIDDVGKENLSNLFSFNNCPTLYTKSGKRIGQGIYLYKETTPDLIYRVNSDNTITAVPETNRDMYKKYKDVPEYVQALEKSMNFREHRRKNQYAQKILINEETVPIKSNRGTFYVPTNVMESIKQAANNVGVSFRRALAIGLNESGLNSGEYKPRQNQFYLYDVDNKRYKPNTVEGYDSPVNLYSDWSYVKDNPYNNLIGAWNRSGWLPEKVQQDGQYQFNHSKSFKKKVQNFEDNIDQNIIEHLLTIPITKLNPGNPSYPQVISNFEDSLEFDYK